MTEVFGLPTQVVAWKDITNLDDATGLVDYGVILGWRDVRRLRRHLDEDGQIEFIRHLAVRFAEPHDTRLPEEILVESILNWLAHAKDERDIQAFLETLLEQPSRTQACVKLVEMALTSESTETEFDEDAFSIAVSLICELGLAVRHVSLHYPGEIEQSDRILSHIATYLLSVSNTNSMCIRLSLLNYFGTTEHDQDVKIGFNKVMSRFGHTVLDQLFSLLFNKKSEAVALQFLLENVPYVLMADHHAQRIVHETWKFYMLKRPQRFGLFLNTLAAHLNAQDGPLIRARFVFAQHLGVLLRVVSEVNHKALAREIIFSLAAFRKDEGVRKVLDQVLADNLVRVNFKDLLRTMRDEQEDNKVIESASRFVAAKRGRKPSFQRANGLLTIAQVQFLGAQPPAAKAS